MHVMCFDQAPSYHADGHFRMSMRQLQGKQAGPSDIVWIGLSIIEPGGGTVVSAARVEKFYVVVEGALEVSAQIDDSPPTVAVLGVLDSCRIAPGETRRLHNRSDQLCKVMLVMPN
ncbi:cupin domain-containing protein [Noviherbaspirillum saxi]|uniref:Cupin domain-containing protein n=1 Tax=Noviherbaspirillum saxi TaxID=2320863 RepID=A0A3A3FJG8_9BURK|nr:cupin domain-containing protein [Noviherbaspirillum saxi]RJF92714.1 cupin domain-containing protein [Noviherbaspirillum saxi]